ncbi:MAG: hypothetical protein AAFX50_18790, partial [Acidobacteriota bacterium]
LAPGETATCTYAASFAGAAGDLPVRALSVEVEDDLGNAAVDDVRVGPRIVEAGSVVFQDGFESGDPSAWSAAVP